MLVTAHKSFISLLNVLFFNARERISCNNPLVLEYSIQETFHVKYCDNHLKKEKLKGIKEQ